MSRLAHTYAVICACAISASADTTPEPIRVRLVAPEGCGSVESFVAQLSARASVRVDESASRTFEVTVTPYTSGGTRGMLVIRARDGDTVRTVDAATCDEALAALTVVAALSVNAEQAREVVVPPQRPHERRVAIGGGVAGSYGVVPAAELGASAFVSLGATTRAQLRLAFARTQEQSGPTSDFRWTTGRIDVRPFAFARGPLVMAAALGLEAGALTARGVMVGSPELRRRPWVAPFVAGRLAVHVDRVAIELEATAAAPLIRDRFFIAPMTTVHQPRVITGGLGLSITVELF